MENSIQPQIITTPPVSPVPSVVPEQPKPKMKRWKKVLLTIVIILVVLVVVVYNMPRILTLMYPGDAVLTDNSQVLLQPVSVPAEDNGFYDFSKIDTCTSSDLTNCNSLISIPKGFDDLAYTNYVKPIQWNQTLVDEVLQSNQQALALFDQGASKNYFQTPDYADPTNLHTDLKLYPMNAWRQVARLQAIKALSLSYQGKPDEALQEAAKLNKVGHQIIIGHNSLIGNLVGMAIQTLGSQTILEILPYGTPSNDTLQSIRQTLKNSSDNTEGYKDAFRFQYTHISNSIDETINKQLDEQIQQMVKDGDTSPAYAKYVKYGYYYKPNQTKNLYANLYNQQVTAIGVKCELNDLDQQVSLKNTQVVSWKIPFTENLVGKLLYRATGIALGSAVTKQCQNDLVSNAVQIQLALRAYKLDNGTLPTALTALMPQYIPSIPTDPFDKQSIKYNTLKKILYSVGLSGQDLGGSSGDDWIKMENPTFKIGF